MRVLELAKRNFKGMWRDWLSLGLNVALPALMLLVLQALEGVDAFFSPTSLAPGIAVFGFAMLTMTSAMALAQDRESSLFARLLTTPLRAKDFVLAYSVPYVAVAIIQAVIVFIIGALLPYKAVSAGWTVVLLLTIFGGTWVNLEDIGGVFQTVGGVLPFAHGLDAARAIMIDGAGFGDIAADFYWVLGHTVGIVALAVFVFRWRMSE